MQPRFTLRDLPLAARLTVAVFLIHLGRVLCRGGGRYRFEPAPPRRHG